MELKDKTAIVTGAGRGIGEGIALALAREGANIVALARRLEGITDVAKRIESQGGKALPLSADVSKKADMEAMVEATLKKFGTIDILVNNAGIEAPPSQVVDLSEEQWDRVLSINLKGVFLCCRAVIPTMIKNNKGKIVNISSLAGKRMSFFGSADYTASKYGLVGFGHHLAWELAEYKINVNTICPGAVLTPLAEESSTPELRNMLTRRLIPLGRFGTPEDIAEAVVFLASERSNWITGQALDVDGGTLTGYGEDLRPVVKKRIADMKAAAKPAPPWKKGN
jgi:NAD(P)-dependent dehydrogenase (short-subunit alcohol dehydrogenase family)